VDRDLYLPIVVLMTTQITTRGQAERALSQRIQALYRNQLGHQPGKITCQIFDEKLAIVIEDSVTQPEQLLVEDGRIELAEQVREDLDNAIRPHLQSLIEEILQVSVLDLLSDATIETGRTGMIVVLETPPQVRPSTSNRKAVKSNS
jgi:uncharacterized protein YbcI